MKELILEEIEQEVINYLYNRDPNCEMPQGFIEGAIALGEITIDDMVNKYRASLINQLK